MSHNSAVSTHAGTGSRGAQPASNALAGHAPSSTPAESHAASTPASHSVEETSERIVPEEKITGESKIVGALRIGEHPADKEKEEKPAEPDLRHHICIGTDCKEPVANPEPPKSDLRRHICIDGPCSCPPGQSWSKGGCAAPANTNSDIVQSACGPGTVWNGTACAATGSCPSGKVWNGASCTTSGQCAAGEIWDGGRCINPATECTSYDARALPIVTELRRLQSDEAEACAQNPGGQACASLQTEQQGDFNRYMALWNEAPAACRTRLAAPGSLI